jgi:hypothetical protein
MSLSARHYNVFIIIYFFVFWAVVLEYPASKTEVENGHAFRRKESRKVLVVGIIRGARVNPCVA